MTLARITRAIAILLLATVCFCAGLIGWVRYRRTYYVSAYREASVVSSGSLAEQRSRLYPVDFNACVLHFEWNTYDNLDITCGPYQFFVVVEPKDGLLDSVRIKKLELTSTQGTKYDTDVQGNYLEITIDPKRKRSSNKSGQRFAFDFAAGEVISTTLTIEFVFPDRVQTHTVELKWKPVLIRYKSSYV